jgi:uncharacterized repeat protein (TIGR03943 family)
MERWRGICLTLLGCTATLWLGATDQLQLYIHPRYVIFTAILAGIGLLLVLFSFAFRAKLGHDKSSAFRVWTGVFAGFFIIFTAISLLVIKPAALTTSAANQRGINSGIGAGIQPTNAVPLFGGGDYLGFDVKDWASLLVQTNDPEFYEDKQALVTGFASPDPDDPVNVYYVTRFIVTCCAVDARPVGVPVYSPNWQSTFKPDTWVEVKGGFISNPSTASKQRVVVSPENVKVIERPKDPYVY